MAYKKPIANYISRLKEINGSDSIHNFSAKTANYSFAVFDCEVNFDCTTGSLTGTLLAAATFGAGNLLIVKKTDASVNTLTISGVNIDGVASLVFKYPEDTAILKCTGAVYEIVSKTFGIDTFGNSAGPSNKLSLFKENMVLGWANVLANGSLSSTNSRFNLTSITRVSTGVYDVKFSVPMTSASEVTKSIDCNAAGVTWNSSVTIDGSNLPTIRVSVVTAVISALVIIRTPTDSDFSIQIGGRPL